MVREYLLRTLEDEEFDLPDSIWQEVVRPSSYPSRVIEGWGVVRLAVTGSEIAFSPEPPGMHVTFEGTEVPSAVADAIVQEILTNLERFTGQKGKIIPL